MHFKAPKSWWLENHEAYGIICITGILKGDCSYFEFVYYCH